MSEFFQDLQKLGAELSSHELPSSTELPGVVGSIVKVLEADGAKVADDLYPQPAEPEAPAAAPVDASGVAPAATAPDAQTESRLSKLETDIGEILAAVRGGKSSES